MSDGLSLVGPASETAINSFLELCKPSENNTENGAWYWVKTGNRRAFHKEYNREKLVTEGTKLMEALMNECRRIEPEEPVFGSKKKGKLGRREFKENAYKIFNTDVRNLAKKHGVLSGKWLFFPNAKEVDDIWRKIVEAIAIPDGPLARFGRVPTAKVSTSGSLPKPDPNVSTTSEPKVKPPRHSFLRIDKDHASGIPVNLWSTSDFMTTHEVNLALAKYKTAIKAAFKARTRAAPEKGKSSQDEFYALEVLKRKMDSPRGTKRRKLEVGATPSR
ncbi:hypothetical protein RQP46_002723 [Phenoliferia psychrophenolica]